MARTHRPRIHITAVASAASDEVRRLTPDGVKGVIALAQAGVGDRYEVTANAGMLLAREIDAKGGRFDDARRAREVEQILADDGIVAMVTMRGGAWFTRILGQINFDVLKRRRRPIYLFGFSEMTTLIAIAGQYPRAIGLYDLGPGFLYGGPRWYAKKHAARLGLHAKLPADQQEGFAIGWALAQFPQRFREFFADVVNIIEGRGSARIPEGLLLAGKLPRQTRITITGGNLSVAAPLIGSPFAGAIDTRGKWLALEDVNEAADPMDRMMAGFKLSGLFEKAEGIILGDFHDKDLDLRDAAFRMLQYHLPSRRRAPIIQLDNFGHIWPIAPLPLQREVTLHCERKGRGAPRVRLEIPWAAWAPPAQ